MAMIQKLKRQNNVFLNFRLSLCFLQTLSFFVYREFSFANDFNSSSIFASYSQEQLKIISQSTRWQRILFYTSAWFTAPKSLVDDKYFFLHPNGKFNAFDELSETLASFQMPPTESEASNNSHALCRFPARRVFLEEALGKKFSQIECPEFENYRNLIKGKGLSVVFSSYHVGNPASMFGHTFFRITNSSPARINNSNENILLDTTISYAAEPTTLNPLLFPIYGLSGGYPGKFAVFPMYVHTQTYNNFESRDMWDYELNISAQELDRILLSLWEVHNINIRYFYLDDNCALLMFALLDIANDSLQFTLNHKSWVLPLDVIRAVHKQPNFVLKRKYLPSNMSRFKLSYLSLSEIQKKELDVWIETNTFSNTWQLLSQNQKAEVLDTYLEHFDWKQKLSGAALLGEFEKERQKLLIARSQLPVLQTAKENIPEKEAPEVGHGVAKYSLGLQTPIALTGLEKNTGIFNPTSFLLSWRPALHGHTDVATGFAQGFEIAFFDLNLTLDVYKNKQKLRLHNLDLFRVSSLDGSFPHVPKWAFHVLIRFGQDLTTANSFVEQDGYFRLDVGFGKAKREIFHRKSGIFALAGIHTKVGAQRNLLFGKTSNQIGPWLWLGADSQLTENSLVSIGAKSTLLATPRNNLEVLLEFPFNATWHLGKGSIARQNSINFFANLEKEIELKKNDEKTNIVFTYANFGFKYNFMPL